MSLAGKFFFHCGKEYSQSGEIVEQIDAATILVRFDRCEHVPASMIAIPLSHLIHNINADGSFGGDWELFNSRDELNAWLEWLDAPDDGITERTEGAMLN